MGREQSFIWQEFGEQDEYNQNTLYKILQEVRKKEERLGKSYQNMFKGSLGASNKHTKNKKMKGNLTLNYWKALLLQNSI